MQSSRGLESRFEGVGGIDYLIVVRFDYGNVERDKPTRLVSEIVHCAIEPDPSARPLQAHQVCAIVAN
jgi:hypothetical protein